MLEDGFQQVIEISTQPMIAYHVKQIAVQENLGDQEWPFVLATLPRKTVPVKLGAARILSSQYSL